MIRVYTDGGCFGNPGPGAWAYVFENDRKKISGRGAVRETTNNRMELTAVIEALKFVQSTEENHDEVDLYTDSQYVKRGITEWIKRWIINGWRNASKKPVKNKDLWVELYDLTRKLTVRWHWVLGHSGNEMNELCDRLVKEEMKRLSVSGERA